MANSANVAVRFDELDKEALREVARRLQRNQSDVLRELVRAALKVLQEQDPRINQTMNPRPRAITRRMKSKNLK